MSSLTLFGKLVIAGVLLVIAGIGFAYVSIKKAHTPLPVACTMEALLCPDGSSVGRTGPNCEFAACPTATTTGSTGSPQATATSTSSGQATSTSGGGVLPYKSGIRGTVMAGPTCPVERVPPDPACADKPLQTLVSIFHANDLVHAVVTTKSSASGAFEASLPPGSYMVGAGESTLPRCTQTPATVASNEYTTIVVQCDTGIR